MTEKTFDTNLRDNARTLAEQARVVGDDLREMGSIAKDTVKTSLKDAKKRGSEAVDVSREKLQDYEDQAVSYVRSHPMKSVLVAAGVGLLIGMFARR